MAKAAALTGHYFGDHGKKIERRRKMLNLKLVLFSLAVASTAHAMPVTYDFTGIVDQLGARELTGLVVGQHIPIVITVDSSAKGSGGFYTEGFDPSVSAVVYPVEFADFNGKDATGNI